MTQRFARRPLHDQRGAPLDVARPEQSRGAAPAQPCEDGGFELERLAESSIIRPCHLDGHGLPAPTPPGHDGVVELGDDRVDLAVEHEVADVEHLIGNCVVFAVQHTVVNESDDQWQAVVEQLLRIEPVRSSERRDGIHEPGRFAERLEQTARLVTDEATPGAGSWTADGVLTVGGVEASAPLFVEVIDGNDLNVVGEADRFGEGHRTVLSRGRSLWVSSLRVWRVRASAGRRESVVAAVIGAEIESVIGAVIGAHVAGSMPTKRRRRRAISEIDVGSATCWATSRATSRATSWATIIPRAISAQTSWRQLDDATPSSSPPEWSVPAETMPNSSICWVNGTG